MSTTPRKTRRNAPLTIGDRVWFVFSTMTNLDDCPVGFVTAIEGTLVTARLTDGRVVTAAYTRFAFFPDAETIAARAAVIRASWTDDLLRAALGLYDAENTDYAERAEYRKKIRKLGRSDGVACD